MDSPFLDWFQVLSLCAVNEVMPGRRSVFKNWADYCSVEIQVHICILGPKVQRWIFKISVIYTKWYAQRFPRLLNSFKGIFNRNFAKIVAPPGNKSLQSSTAITSEENVKNSIKSTDILWLVQIIPPRTNSAPAWERDKKTVAHKWQIFAQTSWHHTDTTTTPHPHPQQLSEKVVV